MLACGVALLLVPSRLVLLPCLIMAAMVTPAQRIVIASADFNFLRIVVMFAMARFITRGDFKNIRWGTLDTLMVAYAASETLIFTLQWLTPGAIINRLGVSFETLGLYFLFRASFRSWSDIASTIPIISYVALLVAGFFAFEWLTHRNLFSIFGGVPERALVRDGRVRCQGAFPHAIIAGSFWAALMPIAGAGWFLGRKMRRTAIIGVGSCLGIVFFTSSSTPAAAVLAAFVCTGLWVMRRYMAPLQAATVCVLIGLHIVMKAPVWHLISRVDLVGGSTGWHRYKLVDNAINRFTEWAALGTKSTAHWGWGMQDITCHYVLVAVRGGFLSLVIFVATIWTAFANIGKAMRMIPHADPRAKLTWGVGVSLGVHLISFIGVSYFGQSTMIWTLSLALSVSVLAAAETTARERRAEAAKRRLRSGATPDPGFSGEGAFFGEGRGSEISP